MDSRLRGNDGLGEGGRPKPINPPPSPALPPLAPDALLP